MNGASSVSERIRAEARGAWNAILGHRFFREVATDSIDDHVFARYLRIKTKGNAEQQKHAPDSDPGSRDPGGRVNSLSHTQGRSRMLVLGSSGSVRGCSATSIPAAILDPKHAFKDTWAESVRKIANAADFGGRRVCSEPAN